MLSIVFAKSKREMNTRTPSIYKSYVNPTDQGPTCAIWEALCAAVAEPDIFKSTVDEPIPLGLFIDELGRKDPFAHVLTEVKIMFPMQAVSSIVSIGTGQSCTVQTWPVGSSRLQKFMPATVITAVKHWVSGILMEEMSWRSSYFQFNADPGILGIALGESGQFDLVHSLMQAYTREAQVSQDVAQVARSIQRRTPLIPTDLIGASK
jgi:hypothetical protein